MAKCNGLWEDIRTHCYELMVDSSYKNRNITNRDVLDNAANFNADYVFPKDYPGEPEETRESLQEFLDLAQQYDGLHGKPIPIIQPPHADHYREHERFYRHFSHFAVGGLQAYDPLEQISIISELREEVGDNAYLHGFGIGTSFPLIKAMRERSPFLDSLDVSTAELAIRNGNIVDKTMEQFTFRTPYGDDSTTVRGQFAKAILVMLNYLLSPLVNSETLEETYYEETALPELQQAVENCSVRSRHDLNFGTGTSTPEAASRQTALNTYE